MSKDNTKYIFVTGGVVSGLGKGVSAASIGRVLAFRGYKVFSQKFDPYLNVDPGTMSPYQHGEVFVTADGAETDLDLGHYERFIGAQLTKFSNYTSGKILSDIISSERKGEYLGRTVQFIPHVTNKIVEFFTKAAVSGDVDFVITEIGGTVGDIESEPFIHALTIFASTNRENVCVVHTTFVPYIKASKEHKSKPTQHSIKILRSYGVNPDFIILRSNERIVEKSIVSKIAEHCMISKEQVLPIHDIKNIYSLPLHFEERNIGQIILKHFKMPIDIKPDVVKWQLFVDKMDREKSHSKTIGLVGKYTEFTDAYMSIIEATKISAAYEDVEIKINWYNSEKINQKMVDEIVENNDGVIVLPGFGQRGFSGKVKIVSQLRDKKIPTLGICYGMQAMVIDQAERKGIKNPISTEHTNDGTPVIDIIENNVNLGGTLRLGNYTSILKKDSVISKIYNNSTEVVERHRHRYEVNPKYKDQIEDKDFIFSGKSKEKGLVEISELRDHPFYIGVQYHPEFNANPLNPSPLFSAFLNAVVKLKK